MNHHSLTQEMIVAYEHWLLQEERAEATREKYLRTVCKFFRWLGTQAVTKERLSEWKIALLSQGYAPTTVNTMLAALNRLFQFLGWTEYSVKYLKVQRHMFRDSGRELTKREYQQLVSAAKEHKQERTALLMETICSTGIRVSEVQFITVEAVTKGETEIRMKGKIRTILLPGKLCRKLRKYAKRQKIASGAIFRTGSGKVMGRCQIWAAMKSVCLYAGVEAKKVFPHNLRHLCAVVYYSTYKDIVKLADILGHSSVETTRIYLLAGTLEYRKRLEHLKLVL